jgi:pRiA4b ORF-3-like protein
MPAEPRKTRARKPAARRRKGGRVTDEFFDFSVTLSRTSPPVRRRFLLRASATFADLHDAIQDAFGWDGSHLWGFRATQRSRDELAGPPPYDDESADAPRVALRSHFRAVGDGCYYTYDFGDNWDHRVRLGGGRSADDVKLRRLISGAMTCPPEDCGGVFGYARIKEFSSTGVDPFDDPESLSWYEGWDPGAFDLDEKRRAFDR